MKANTAREVLDSVGNTIDEVNASFKQELTNKANCWITFTVLHPKVPMSDWLNWILLSRRLLYGRKCCMAEKPSLPGTIGLNHGAETPSFRLPGLMLVTGRFSDAKEILQNFIQYCKSGLNSKFYNR